MIGSQLLRYQTDQTYLCWDVESEGLNLRFARPWQLAWVLFRGDEVLERASHLIRWEDISVSPDAARISHFNPKDYALRAEDPTLVLAALERHLYDPAHKIIGHNLFFDAYMHRNWRRELGLPEDWSWMDRLIDTNVLAKALKKGWAPDSADYTGWQWRVADFHEKTLKSNLTLTAREQGIEVREDKTHDAAYDVEVNMAVFNKLKWAIEI